MIASANFPAHKSWLFSGILLDRSRYTSCYNFLKRLSEGSTNYHARKTRIYAAKKLLGNGKYKQKLSHLWHSTRLLYYYDYCKAQQRRYLLSASSIVDGKVYNQSTI